MCWIWGLESNARLDFQLIKIIDRLFYNKENIENAQG